MERLVQAGPKKTKGEPVKCLALLLFLFLCNQSHGNLPFSVRSHLHYTLLLPPIDADLLGVLEDACDFMIALQQRLSPCIGLLEDTTIRPAQVKYYYNVFGLPKCLSAYLSAVGRERWPSRPSSSLTGLVCSVVLRTWRLERRIAM